MVVVVVAAYNLLSFQWFLDDSKLTDEDDIKFKADYHYFKKNYDTALNIYMDLLKGEIPSYMYVYYPTYNIM